MIDLLEIVLAARRRSPGGGKFQWLVPIGFAVFYLINVIAKVKEKQRQDKELDRELDKTDSQAGAKRRYKPLVDITITKTSDEREAPKRESRLTVRDEPLRELPSEVLAPQTTRYPVPAARKPQAKRRPTRSRPVKRVGQQVPAKLRQKVKSVQVDEKAKPAAKHAELPQIAVFKNLADTGNLRTAIILAEVLGKPRALREFQ
jgi:hypothetical protein